MSPVLDPRDPHSSDTLLERRSQQRREARRRQVRRRRAGLIIGVVAAVALLVVLFGGGTDHVQDSVAGHTGTGARHRTAHASAPTLLARENTAIDTMLARQPFINAGGGERREIALTFDDGPGPYTPLVLDQLERLHVPATFFEIGFMYQWFHDSVTRELALGEVIGDHTETHPHMAQLPPATQENEILQQTQWLQAYGGSFPRLWRPPYGSYSAATLAILHKLRMLMVLWTVDTDDYLQPGVQAIVDRAVAGAKPGAILLLHDAGGTRTQTVAALPLIIAALRRRHYTLVTIPQMILDDPPRHPEVLPTNLAGG